MLPTTSIPQSDLKSLNKNDAVRAVFECLPTARVVGGAVRDILLGVAPKDFDMAVPLSPDEIIEQLKKKNLHVIPTGLAHGTVTVLVGKDQVELTSLRRDIHTDGRHAAVVWTKDWKEDAARRDFTINALSLDQEGHIFDYFDGIKDISSGNVKFVGDASQRIHEDGLRILRFFRFYGRFGKGQPNQEAVSAISNGLLMLGVLSAERIANELKGILSDRSRVEVVQLMKELGVLDKIYQPSKLATFEKLSPKASVLTCLGALFRDPAIGKRLKLSNADYKFLVEVHKSIPDISSVMIDTDIKKALYQQSRDVLVARLEIAQAQDKQDAAWSALIEKIKQMDMPEFPLVGDDVKDLGVAEGQAIGTHLNLVKQWWLESGTDPDREACLKRLKDSVEGAI